MIFPVSLKFSKIDAEKKLMGPKENNRVGHFDTDLEKAVSKVEKRVLLNAEARKERSGNV
jgi:hypothetical protein